MGQPRKNIDFLNCNLFEGVPFSILSPMDTWPDPPKGAKYHAASSLKVGTHFKWMPTPADDLEKLKKFLNWFPAPKLKEYVLEIEITKTLADIYRSNKVIRHSKYVCVCACVGTGGL